MVLDGGGGGETCEQRVRSGGRQWDDLGRADLQPVLSALDGAAAGERHELGAQADSQGRHARLDTAADQVSGGGQPGVLLVFPGRRLAAEDDQRVGGPLGHGLAQVGPDDLAGGPGLGQPSGEEPETRVRLMLDDNNSHTEIMG